MTKTHEMLKVIHRQVRDKQSDEVGLRIHRALSWLDRAEKSADDLDVKFVCLWIAFNALYVEGQPDSRLEGERKRFFAFFARIKKLDSEGSLYDAFWQNFSGPVQFLMKNKFVFGPFWHHQNGLPKYKNWESRFVSETKRFNTAFQNSDTVGILQMIFDRLYVLRNQIMHGGATWGGSVNRDQIRDGANILAFLVPNFIEIMMDNPSEDWGQPFYPRLVE